jgi:hypothetical protein
MDAGPSGAAKFTIAACPPALPIATTELVVPKSMPIERGGEVMNDPYN